MRTPRARGASQQMDVYPQLHACPVCHHVMQERYHQQRWIVRLDQPVKVVRHVLECGHTACMRQALGYRPQQEAALAVRGYTFGLEVVARLGELRDRNTLSMIKIREQRQTESPLSIARHEVAWRCEVVLALVTTVARQDEELIAQVKALDGSVLAIDGGQPEKSHAPRDIVRDVRSGRVFVAKTLLSSATPEIAPLIAEVLSRGRPIVGVSSEQQASIGGAGHHTLHTVPHQSCPYHEWKDVAQPICDADRHCKEALQKKIRGMREIARQAEAMPRTEAPLVADDCLAVRTVRRDDGQYPLEPAGVTLSQKLPLMVASVARVMGAPPSALLKPL